MAAKDTIEESRASTEASLHDVEKAEKPTPEIKGDDDEFPTDWRKIALIMLALYLSMFLVALVSK
jgi:hypothetical protein